MTEKEKETITEKLISDKFINRTRSLVCGATKGELYYIFNQLIQDLVARDSEDNVKNHFEVVLWMIKK